MRRTSVWRAGKARWLPGFVKIAALGTLADVVPRAWTHLLAEVIGHDIDPATDTPDDWRTYVVALVGQPAPLRMTDGGDTTFDDWANGYDPSDWLDRAVTATRKAVFPLHGLDPNW